MFHHPGPHHDLPQRLHQLGCARDRLLQHLQPPVVDTGRLCGHVAALPHRANALQDGSPLRQTVRVRVPLPAGSHSQLIEVRQLQIYPM